MGKCILIVEDNAKNYKLVKDLVEIHGYSTIRATDGMDGMTKAIEYHPDLILMDIQMPRMNGIEATKKIKSNDKIKHIPIIVLTSYAMKGDEEKIRNAGADDYMAKPIDIKKLLVKIESHFNK